LCKKSKTFIISSKFQGIQTGKNSKFFYGESATRRNDAAMNPQRWRQTEEIFQAALDLPPDEREKFIAEKCGEDDDLRREIEKLIARYEKDETFLESPVWTDSRFLQSEAKREIAASLDEEILTHRAKKNFINERVGVYRLTEELGKGGMGVVYLAVRADGEFEQKAAVKLIKRGMDTDFIIKRFRHERQIVANLNHPNIARLLDGGTLEDGSPYFVMEFIEGEPLLRYAARKNLDWRKKLELFLQICAAVSYAHRKKIIHRDIKPSNILVTETGEPKLLDFGIAKILDADAIHDSMIQTATAMRLMTPEYASPEQVRGDDVTASSDQYSLGVLLYELLSGTRPYKFPSRAPHEIARVVCEQIPSAPSNVRFGNIISEIDFRSDENLSKKLDRIVLKALRKDSAERYASVEEFAADIERFLRGERVRAESFTNGQTENILLPEKKRQTIKQETKPDQITQKRSRRNSVSPRRKGIKQGVFLILLTILLIPVFLIATVTAIIPPPLITLVFLLMLCGGAARILFAFFFESGNTVETGNSHFNEAETELVQSAPRETIANNQTTAEKNNDKQTDGEKSIAVLPFKNLDLMQGEDIGGKEFLSVGLADALITRLSKVRSIIVRPTSSILRFGGNEKDSFAAGRELNVRFVLDGNILRTEKRLRISVQLLDVANLSTVWADRFDEDPADVLNLEDSISSRVAEFLVPQLSTGEARNLARRSTFDADAYEAYLRGRFYWNTFTEDGFRRAIEYYRQAVEIDPDYAQAHAAIADYYNWLGMMNILPAEEFYPPAKSHALRAVQLDENLSDAHAALGLTRIYGEFDWQESEREMLRAIELNPNNSVAHLWFTHTLLTKGRIEESINYIARAVQIDPESLQNHLTEAWTFYFARRFEEAIAKAVELIEKFPLSPFPYFAKSCFFSMTGRGAEALPISAKMLELSGDNLFIYGRAQALASAGERDEAIKLIEPAKESPTGRRYIANYHAAVIYGLLNEKEKALDALDRALAAHEGMLIWMGIEPLFDSIRDDARFQKLLKKINHPLTGKFNPATHGFDTKPVVDTKRSNSAKKIEKRGVVTAFKFILPVLAVLVSGFAVYYFSTLLTFHNSSTPPELRWKNVFASTMNLRRLTSSGKARRPVISPDGSRVAYVLDDAGQQSLWIRPTDSEKAEQLIAPTQLFYTNLKFSPDGQYVYFIRTRTPGRALYRISTSGGTPEKVSENAYNIFAFSPDGSSIVYDYTNPDTNERSLYLAELNEKSLIKTVQPIFALELPNFFPGGLDFSPDGKKLVYSRSLIEGNKQAVHLYTYDFETKANERLVEGEFIDINSVAWRAGGEEIVIAASEKNSAPSQLWLVEYPTGAAARLTNDFSDYLNFNLSADSNILVSERRVSASNISTGEITSAGKIVDANLKPITGGVERQDGLNGVNWTKDGRILYAAGNGNERNISIMNADGSDNRTITTGASDPSFPSLTADGRFLIYADEKDQELNIIRFDFTNGMSEKLNTRYAVTPALAPDDRTVFFSMLKATENNELTVFRRSLDGGPETALTEGLSVRPVVSPDNRFVACNFSGEETERQWQVAIFHLEENDTAPRIIKPYTNNFFRHPQTRSLAWSPDGKSLYFINYVNNIANIFRGSVEGDLKPVAITNFTSGEIFDFAVAPDGKRFVLSRGSTSSDVVIFKK